MIQLSKLIKSFPGWSGESGAIFKTLASLSGATEAFPWLENAAVLDLEYIGNRSGEKTISPIMDRFVEDNVESEQADPLVMTSGQRLSLAYIIRMRYADKWTKLWAVQNAEYNPIENYSMTEEETPDITRQHKVSSGYEEREVRSIDRDLTRTERATDDYSESEEIKDKTDYTVEQSTGTSGDVYGFNSSSPVPTQDASGTSTEHRTGSADDNVRSIERGKVGGTVVTESADADDNKETTVRSQTGYREDTETGTRTLTRSGNIGVTTSQQMLQSEIELWQWNFYDQVFEDVDSVLTTPVYSIFERGKYR